MTVRISQKTASQGKPLERQIGAQLMRRTVLGHMPADPSQVKDVDAQLLAFDAIEAAIAVYLTQVRGLLVALGELLGQYVPGVEPAPTLRKHASDRADNTVAMGLCWGLEALERCKRVQTLDLHLNKSRDMLAQLCNGLSNVDIDSDSAPGVALLKLYMPCAHLLLSARSSDTERNNALDMWKEKSERILGDATRAMRYNKANAKKYLPHLRRMAKLGAPV